MAQEQGYRCPYTGEPFSIDQLVGYGQPPRSPACPVGYGSGSPMAPIVVAVTRSATGEATSVKEVAGKLWADVGKAGEPA